MTQDQNKKTLRHFQCRDYLWEIFEQMSSELECSTDYLINEAMRQYARSRNYGTTQGPSVSDGATTARPPEPRPPQGPIPSLRGNQRPSGAAPPPPPPRRANSSMAPPSTVPAPPRMPASMPPPPRAPQAPQAPQPPQGQAPIHSTPPPLPGGGRPSMAPTGGAQLYIIFNGQKIPVTKDEFVIGRGSKSADLPIKDGNISRRHAAVVRHNEAHFIKDLGSTNGVEFQGRRFESKRIEEGDVYRLCDYEIQFTYR